MSVLFLTKDLVFSSRVAGVAQSRQSRGEFNNRMTEVLVKYVAVGGQTADKAKASDLSERV